MSTATLPMYEWKTIPWPKLQRNVFKLQKRIYQASQRGDIRTVHQLQRLLLSSQSARMLATRRVTQDKAESSLRYWPTSPSTAWKGSSWTPSQPPV